MLSPSNCYDTTRCNVTGSNYRIERQDSSSQLYEYFEKSNRQKTCSKIGSNIGPELPAQLLMSLRDASVTHLNLHANNLESIVVCWSSPHCVDEDHLSEESISAFPSIEVIDLSSNRLERGNTIDQDGANSSKKSFLHLVPNLRVLNLSANNLVVTSLDRLGFQPHNVLFNLQILDLSHNNISIIPKRISISCPHLSELNLANNVIEDLLNLSQLATLQRLRNFVVKSNPLCKRDPSFRKKIILQIPTLIKCDNEEIDDEERNNVWMNQTIGNRENGSKINDRSNMKSMKKALNKQNLQSVRQHKMKNTMEKISLSKLNKLEFEVQKLSKLAVEQVEATKHLHDAQNVHMNTHPRAKESAIGPNEVQQVNRQDNGHMDKVRRICNATIQTDAVDEQFVCVGKKDGGEHISKLKVLSMAAGLYKWKAMILQHKLIKTINMKKEKETNKIEECLIDVVHSCKKHMDQYNESKTGENAYVELRGQCNILDQTLQRKVAELSALKETHKLEISRIQKDTQIELEQIQTEMELKRQKETKLYKQQKVANSKLMSENKELETALLVETAKGKRLEKNYEIQIQKLEKYEANEIATSKVSKLEYQICQFQSHNSNDFSCMSFLCRK